MITKNMSKLMGIASVLAIMGVMFGASAQATAGNDSTSEKSRKSQASITFVGRDDGPIKVIEGGEARTVGTKLDSKHDPAAEAINARREQQEAFILERRRELLEKLKAQNQARAGGKPAETPGSEPTVEQPTEESPELAPPGPRDAKPSEPTNPES